MKEVFELSNLKVLIYLYQKEDARYSELLNEVISSRSTLALTLRHLQDDGLIERKVEATRPIQTRYVLTPKGREIAKSLASMKKLLQP